MFARARARGAVHDHARAVVRAEQADLQRDVIPAGVQHEHGGAPWAGAHGEGGSRGGDDRPSTLSRSEPHPCRTVPPPSLEHLLLVCAAAAARSRPPPIALLRRLTTHHAPCDAAAHRTSRRRARSTTSTTRTCSRATSPRFEKKGREGRSPPLARRSGAPTHNDRARARALRNRPIRSKRASNAPRPFGESRRRTVH